MTAVEGGYITNLVTYDPYTDTGLDELFRGFFAPVRVEGARAPMMIRMDVTESADGYMIHAEMPGMMKEDIDVKIEGSQVTITAETKREWDKKDGDRMLRSERYFGNIYRSFTLPAELNEALSEAKYDKGVLELKLVRKASVVGKKLPVL